MYKNVKSTSLIFTIAIAMLISSFNVSGQFSKARLHPNCLKIEPTTHLSAEWGMRLFAGASFYIPFGSSQAINHISKLISSGSKADESTTTDPEKSVEVIPGFCALVRIRGFRLEMEGHNGKYMVQDCSVIKKGMNDCIINGQSENPFYQKHGDSIVIIVWTDNETSMAIVRCTADGLYNDWYVFSTLTSLNDTMKESILTAVGKLGFPNNPESTLSPSYKGCKLFTPTELEDE